VGHSHTQYYYAVRGGGLRFSLSRRRRETITSHTKFQKARDFQRDLPPVACCGLVKNNAHVVLLRARGIQLAFYSGCASLFILYSLYSVRCAAKIMSKMAEHGFIRGTQCKMLLSMFLDNFSVKFAESIT